MDAIIEIDPKTGSAPAGANVCNTRALQKLGGMSWSALLLDALQVVNPAEGRTSQRVYLWLEVWDSGAEPASAKNAADSARRPSRSAHRNNEYRRRRTRSPRPVRADRSHCIATPVPLHNNAHIYTEWAWKCKPLLGGRVVRVFDLFWLWSTGRGFESWPPRRCRV